MIVIPLFVIFLILKLAHVIAWPWIWIISPLWIAGILSFLVWVGCMTFLGAVASHVFKGTHE